MKQKIVVKVHKNCGKCMTEAMKIAAAESGVSSIQIQGGENKDQVVVIGNEVDSIHLTKSLRKKVGCVTLLSVQEVKETKKQNKDNVSKKENKDNVSHMTCYPSQPVLYYQMVQDRYPDNCSIM